MIKNFSINFIILSFFIVCCGNDKDESKDLNSNNEKKVQSPDTVKMRKEYLSTPFIKNTNLFGGVTLDLNHSRSSMYTKSTSLGDIDKWIPNAPVFHNYNTDPSPQRYILNARLKESIFFDSLPLEIRSICEAEKIDKNNHLSIFLSFQYLESESQGHTCFRPQYFFDQKAPNSFAGSRYNKTIKAGLFALSHEHLGDTSDSKKQLVENKMGTFNISVHDNVISPDNLWAKLPRINNEILSFYTLVIGPSFDNDEVLKAAVTFHFYLDVGREVQALEALLNSNPNSFYILFQAMKEDQVLKTSKAYKQLVSFLAID